MTIFSGPSYDLREGAPLHFCRPGSPQGTRAASRPKGGEASGPNFPVGPPGRRAVRTRERARPRSREGGAGETRCGKTLCVLTINGGPDGPLWGKVGGWRGRDAPYGSPALRSTRAGRSGAATRGAKTALGTRRRGWPPNPLRRAYMGFWCFLVFVTIPSLGAAERPPRGLCGHRPSCPARKQNSLRTGENVLRLRGGGYRESRVYRPNGP